MILLLVVVAAALIAAVLVAVEPVWSRASEPMDVERQERWIVAHAPSRLRSTLRYVDRRVFGGAITGVALAVLFAGALLVGWVLDTVDEHRGVARWDESAAEWGAENATEWSTRVLDAITELGSFTVLAVVIALVGIWAFVRRREWRSFAYLAVVGLGVSLVNNALKWSIDRERPDIAQLTGHGGSSFPSGHSAAAAACWAALALVVTRRAGRNLRLVGAALAVLVAVAVATTRVLLGVHWVSDVVAGVAVGWSWFLLTTLIFGGRLLRFGEPVERVQRGQVARDVDHDLAVQDVVEHEEVRR